MIKKLGALLLSAAYDNALKDLDKPSADCEAMQPYWRQVSDIVTGAKAMRANSKEYLPQLPNEDENNYKHRVKTSKFTNIYRDIVEGLASKPFSVPVQLDQDGLPAEIEAFCDDVDGSSNSLTVYAAQCFFDGINNAVDWIFVDYPDVAPATDTFGNPRVRSKQEEADLGVRPFWSRIAAFNMLEVRSKIINGKETLTYMRVLEPGDVRHVRIMEADETGARWKLYREVKGDTQKKTVTETLWEVEKSGVFSIGIIPVVPFMTGRRDGKRWHWRPAMQDAADLQIELYREESGLNHVTLLSGFPMLAANGIAPDRDPQGNPKPIKTGPYAVLYAPPMGSGSAGSWAILQPSADVMNFMLTKVEKTQTALRELGRQPLTAQSAQLTVITTAVAAQKANSAVQMWAYNLADALANALIITAMWYNVKEWEPEVSVFTDFDVDGQGNDDLTQLRSARDAGDLSQRTYWKELQRRNVLAPDFDADDEEAALLDEGPSDDEVTDANGNVVKVDPLTGLPIKPPIVQPPVKDKIPNDAKEPA